jgi:general secretion pathway protein C
MNKRVPLILSLIGVILLAVSLAYWILQLYQPPQRPLAAVPQSAMPDPSIDAAATLFGGQVAVASATNYQLTGIISAGHNSVAIIVADGSPPKALRLGKELAPGITLAEVYPRYVMLSDGGAMKRLDLAADAKPAAPMGGPPAGAPGAAMGTPAAPQPPPPITPESNAEAAPALASPVPAGPLPAENNAQPEPPMAPGAVSQQVGPTGQPVQSTATAPAPVQMPPPTRSTASPVNQTAPTQ